MQATLATKVLVVDDNPLDAMVIERLLRNVVDAEYDVRVCENAEQAWLHISAGWPDICLVDYYLDESTAEDILLRLRDAENPSPVIVLTGENRLDVDQRAMRAGAMDFLPKTELSSALLERTIRYVCFHASQQRELSFKAECDALTGAYNRAHMQQLLEGWSHSYAETGQELGIAYIDFDGFKLVNDSLGHEAGDLLLCGAAERINACVQQPKYDAWLARWGGDEFVLALRDADEALFEQLVDEIFEALEQPFSLNGTVYFLSASVGLAKSPEAGGNHESLLRHADSAMYAAKRSGRNQWQWHQATEGSQLGAVTSNLILGFNNRHVSSQLRLWGQPQLDVREQSVPTVELLARYHVNGSSDNDEVIAAGRFIEALEQGGHAYSFGIWALEQAAQYYLQYQSQLGNKMPRLGVNIGGAQYLSPRFIEDLDAVLAAHGVPGSALEIEITESCLLNDVEAAVEVGHALKERGVGIAVDDFGTGYSSLHYLSFLPLTALKIDREFVSALGRPEANSIYRWILGLAGELNLRAVTEGIETQAQQKHVVGEGARYLQGYHVARPMPMAECMANILKAGRRNLQRSA